MFEKSERTILAVGAEGPGIENTLILFSAHTLIRSDPGSDIIGVPESNISAIDWPNLIFL